MKIRIVIDVEMLEDEIENCSLSAEKVKNSIVVYPDDVSDGFVVTTELSEYGYDNLTDYFLGQAKIVSKEII